MNLIRIILGTNSEFKINFVKKILAEMNISFEIFPIKTTSGVSEQPLTENETLLGSINRAKSAIKINKELDIGLEIETGYQKDEKGLFEIFCYASITEKKGGIYSACSHKFLLSKQYQKVLKNNQEISKYVKDYYEEDSPTATQYLAKMIDEREHFIIEVV